MQSLSAFKLFIAFLLKDEKSEAREEERLATAYKVRLSIGR